MHAQTPWHRLSVLAWLLLLSMPGPAAVLAQHPGAGELARLDDRLLRARAVRVAMPSGMVVVEGARASLEGLAYRRIRASALGETLPVPGRISWDAVLRVDVPGSNAGRAAIVSGVIVGGLTAAALVGIAAAGRRGDDPGGGTAVLYAGPLIVGLATGIGALTPAWHRVHPRRRASKGVP